MARAKIIGQRTRSNDYYNSAVWVWGLVYYFVKVHTIMTGCVHFKIKLVVSKVVYVGILRDAVNG